MLYQRLLDALSRFLRLDAGEHIDEHLIAYLLGLKRILNKVYLKLMFEERRHGILNALVIYRLFGLILI